MADSPSSFPPTMPNETRCYTYEEIGLELGVSGERVRQIEMRVLRKLARVTRFRKLPREMVDS